MTSRPGFSEMADVEWMAGAGIESLSRTYTYEILLSIMPTIGLVVWEQTSWRPGAAPLFWKFRSSDALVRDA
jgi:hypothetical protein